MDTEAWRQNVRNSPPSSPIAPSHHDEPPFDEVSAPVDDYRGFHHMNTVHHRRLGHGRDTAAVGADHDVEMRSASSDSSLPADIRDRMKNMESSLASIEGKISNVDTSIGLMQGSINVMQQSMVNMESTLQGVQTTLVQMQTSWTNIDANLAPIPQTYTSICDAMINLHSSIASTNSTLDTISRTLMAILQRGAPALSLIPAQADGATGAAAAAPTARPAAASVSRLAQSPFGGHPPVAGSPA